MPFLVSLTIACGLACSRGESPQASFDHAYKAFLQGDLKRSQEEAHRQYERLRSSDSHWAGKFRILEAESLLWRGMYAQALSLLDSPALPSGDKPILAEALAIKGVAHARLHQFSEAEKDLDQASQLCQVHADIPCGDVIRAQGVLAVQLGQMDSAKRFFLQSLDFARSRKDSFLEATALLNLGLTSLREEHFDEAIDWTDAAYRASLAMGAGNITQTAMGNLGWAYYNLGDSERSLELSLEAERRARQVGNIILE